MEIAVIRFPIRRTVSLACLLLLLYCGTVKAAPVAAGSSTSESLWTNPAVAALVGGAFGGLIGTVGLAVLEVWKDRSFRPNLTVHYDGGSGSIRTTWWTVENRRVQAKFVRVRVRNIGNRTAKGCRGYLVNIERFDGSVGDRRFVDTIRLRWAYELHGKAWKEFERGTWNDRGLDLLPGPNYYLDVLRIYAPECEDGRAQAETVAISGPDSDAFQHKTTYRLTVAVAADGAEAKEIRLLFRWGGDWNNFDVSPDDSIAATATASGSSGGS
jgi:hypothetical protein